MTGRANKSGRLPDQGTLTGGLGTRTGSPAAQNVRFGAPKMVMLANQQRAHNGGYASAYRPAQSRTVNSLTV
jgi:hypothetical protein